MLPNIETELTQEQKDQIKAAKEIIPKLKKQILTAQSAGIDVSDYQKQLAEIEMQLEKLYRVYVRKQLAP